MIKLDPRIKVVIALYLNVVLFTAQNQFTFIFNAVLVVGLFLLSKKFKEGLVVSIVITVMLSLQHIFAQLKGEYLKITLGLLFFLLLKCVIITIIGYWFTITTKIGDLVSAMQSAKVPSGVIIALSVVFRFLPTVRDEYWYIKSTMKLRQISPTLKGFFTHPIRTIEYALIPLIMRSLNIGSRLSVSAMTRGLNLEQKRTSFNVVKLRAFDFIFCFIIIALSVSSIFIGGML